MCICCCCSRCCNSQTSKCIETSILLLSIINFIGAMLILICVKLSHITFTTKIFLIIIIVFTIFNLLSIIFIYLWRNKELINTSKNSPGLCFTRIGLVLCILLFFLSIYTEVSLKNNLTDLDYPCLNYVYGINMTSDENGDIIWVRNLANEGFTEKEKEFCELNQDPYYYADICSYREYAITYISPSMIEILTIVLCFFWHNDGKRIKARVDGALGNRTSFGGRGSIYAGNIYGANHFRQQYGMAVFDQNNILRSPYVDIRGNIVMNMNFGRKRNSVVNYMRSGRNSVFNNVNDNINANENICGNKKDISRNNDNSSERSKNSIGNYSSTRLRVVKKKKRRKSKIKTNRNNIVVQDLNRNINNKNNNKNENIENIPENKNENENKEEQTKNKNNVPVKEGIKENEEVITGGNNEKNKDKNIKDEKNTIKLNVIESNLNAVEEKKEPDSERSKEDLEMNVIK